MNNRFKRIVAAFLSAASVLGICQAHAQDARTIRSRTIRESIRLLLSDGIIVQLPKPNWYRINQALLDAKIKGDVPSANSISEVIESLRDVVGPGVNVKEVDIFEAVYGTQDAI